MKHKTRGALCAAMAAFGMSTAVADVWIAYDRVLESRDIDGSIVTSVSAPFGTPIGTIIDQGEVDPRTGNVWIVSRELGQSGSSRVVHVLGVTPSGEGLWEHAETGTGFIEPTIAIDPGRQGIWVLRAVSAENPTADEAVLYDQLTGEARATIRGLTSSGGLAAVGADGAIWIDGADGWIRLEGSIEDLDGYEVVGRTGPHHRTVEPDPDGFTVAVDRSDGSLYFMDQLSDPTEEILAYLVKFSAAGEQLFRVRHGASAPWVSVSDLAIDPRDGSVYVTEEATPIAANGSASHVSPAGADLGTVEYREHVDSVAVDPEDGGVWIAHMPVVDDDQAFIAPMVLRKLDSSSLQTDLSVPFESVVTVIGAAPTTLAISLDIEPRDKRSVVNLIPPKGELRVALLSSAAFDALQVDIDTVRFGTAGAVVRSYWTRDVNRDGHTDLVVAFRTAHTGIKCGDTAAPLTAETHGGVDVYGTELLQTRCKR